MKLIKRNRSQARERGSQIAEFALVLPLLLFLALIVSEGAALMRVHQVLNNAAREGAHLATFDVNQNSTGAIQLAVADYASRNGISLPPGNVSVNQSKMITTPSGTAMSGSQVVVTYAYTLKYLPKLPWFNVSNVINLGASSEFRNFY